MKEDNNIEDLFRSSFDHFEVAPPSSVKGAIDRELGAVTGKRGWWIFGSLSLIIAASLVFFFYTSSAKQAAGSSNGQLASNQTTDNSSASTATGHSAANSSVDQTSSSSSNQEGRDNTTSQGTAGTKNQGHSDGTQAGSSTKAKNTNQSKARRTPSMTSSRSSKKNSAVKTGTSKLKGTSGNKPSAKKSSGKKPKKNAGTPGFGDLTPQLDLTMFDPDPSKTLNVGDNTPVEGDGKTNASDPKSNGNPDTNPPAKTDPPVNDQKEDPVAEKADSTQKEATKKKPPVPNNKSTNWMASVYAGPSFSNNVKGDEFRSLSEKPGFQFSGEINRSFVAGYGVTTGASFSKRQETFKYTALQILDSAYTVTDSIPIYGNPNAPDSITGYYDTTYYVDDTISTDLTQLNRIQTIGIPLYFTKHFSFSDKWGLLVNAGAVFQFYNVSQGELNGMPAPTINDFGVNVSGRFHATYSWNNWMFSAGVNTGFELKQAVIYEGLDRKRYFISPQLGIHFRF